MSKKQNVDQKVSEALVNKVKAALASNRWVATPKAPIYLYYCKANISDGNTCVVMQDNIKNFCNKVRGVNCTFSFEHCNTVGKAKASGAKAALKILFGAIYKEK